MTNEEHIKSLTTLLEMQTKMHETAVDMLKPATEAAYQKGYNDAMGWKTQNHLEHLPPKSANWMKECADFWNRYIYINEMAQEEYDEEAQMWIKKLRAAQPQPEPILPGGGIGRHPEPVAQCTNSDTWNCKYCRKTETCDALKDPRNFAPPQREWVGLTGEELEEIYQSAGTVHFKFARIEAKLREKNAND